MTQPHTETVSVGTSATALRPADPHTDGDRGHDDAVARMYVPSGGNTVRVGGSGVTNSTGVEVAAGESYEWNPGRTTLYGAAETSSQDVTILWSHAGLNDVTAPVKPQSTAPGS